MFSAALSTLLVLSVYCNQAVLGQAANPTAADSPAGGNSSATGGSSSALGLAAGLSPGCQAAAGGLLTSEFGSCSNIMGFVSVIGASGSIVTPLSTWISGVCSASPCSADTLKQANQTVSTDCSADIQKGSGIAVALTAVVSNFAGARDLLCTQYSSNSTFCVPSILENVQAASGRNITIAELSTMLSGGMSPSAQAFANVPSSTYCNDCGHALVTEAARFLAGSTAGGVTNGTAPGAMSSISGTCGASFADGKVPSSVRIAGQSAAKAKSSAAAPRLPVAYAAAVPVALATLFLASLV